MKAKTCFESESPARRYDRLMTQVAKDISRQPVGGNGLLGRARWTLLQLAQDLSRLTLSSPEVLVEVSRGMVREVKLVNGSAVPVKVVVRDYDNLKVDPEDYQDDVWTLEAKESGI